MSNSRCRSYRQRYRHERRLKREVREVNSIMTMKVLQIFKRWPEMLRINLEWQPTSGKPKARDKHHRLNKASSPKRSKERHSRKKPMAVRSRTLAMLKEHACARRSRRKRGRPTLRTSLVLKLWMPQMPKKRKAPRLQHIRPRKNKRLLR